MVLGSPFFRIGITLAILKQSINVPLAKDILKIRDNAFKIFKRAYFNTFAEMLSTTA